MQLRNALLAIGVLALVAGATLAVLWLTGRPAAVAVTASSEQVASNNVKAILVAARPIPAGTLLRPEDVKWNDVPASDVTPTQIPRDPAAESKYVGALATKPLATGEALVTTALLKPSDRGFLAALLAPGMRAVSIAVDAQQSASGLLLPDNRVDIILTQTFENDADPARKSVGETILKNLRVIAIDQRMGAVPASAVNKTLSADASIPKIITLEVTEREAEALMVAGRIGRLDVSVRSLGLADANEDGGTQPHGTLWAADVSPALNTLRRVAPPSTPAPGLAQAPMVAAAAPAPNSQKSIVEVMHGSKIEAH